MFIRIHEIYCQSVESLKQAVFILTICVATVVATVTRAAADDLVSTFLAPEGVEVGMTGPEARALLESKGFQLQKGSCRFQRLNSSSGGASHRDKIEIALTLLDLNSTGRPPGTIDALKNQMAQREVLAKCGTDSHLVSGLTWKEWRPRTQPVEPKADVDVLSNAYGAFKTCSVQQAHSYKWCRWHGLAQAPKLDEVLFSSSKGGYREISLKGVEARLRPVDPARAANVDAMRLQALTVCENYRPGGGADLFRALNDCGCIADKVSEGYGAGEIDQVDVQAINKYDDNCPASAEKLNAHFLNECEQNYGNPNLPYAAWAKSGGCTCFAEKSAAAFQADPRAFFPHLAGIGAASLGACGFNDADKIAAKAEEEKQASLPAAPEGLKPLSTRLFNGLPIAFRDASGRLSDPVGGDTAVEAFRRYIMLQLVKKEPELLAQPDMTRFMAGLNLPATERDQLMKGCTERSSNYCEWQGADEFEKRRNQKTFTDGAGQRLSDLAAQIGDEIVVVETLRLMDYDVERGGFPIRASAQRTQRYRIFGGYWGLTPSISLVHPEGVMSPTFWKMEPVMAEAMTDHLLAKGLRSSQQRFVYLAWTYKLGAMALNTEFGQNVQEISVETRRAIIATDQELSDVLTAFVPNASETIETGFKDLAPADGASQASTTANEGGTLSQGSVTVSEEKQEERKAALATHPFELVQQDGAYVYPLRGQMAQPNAKLRFINLLLVGAQPDLAVAQNNAIFLAHQNLIGLTEPIGKRWLGQSEFDRLASQKTYADVGASRIKELGISLPVKLRTGVSIPLMDYDFAKEVFPFRGRAYGQTVQGPDLNKVLLHPWTNSIVEQKPVWAHLTNGAFPKELALSPEEAEKASKLLGPGHRKIFIGTTLTLTALSFEKDWKADAEIESMAFYTDESMSQKIKHVAF